MERREETETSRREEATTTTAPTGEVVATSLSTHHSTRNMTGMFRSL